MKQKYEIFNIDPYLMQYENDINLRMEKFEKLKKKILKNQSLVEFASAYEFYGFHKVDGGYIYREWAPNAVALFLVGDFNGWDKWASPMKKLKDGNWEIFVDQDLNDTYVKVRVVADNFDMERIPIYANYVERDEKFAMTPKIYNSTYEFQNKNFKTKGVSPMIYECHIGMATEEEKIGSYDEFRENVLPKIKEMGFNTIQIMGVMEHPYYGSFGYQVSNFFAPCSLFGKPDDLKRLIDEAHGMGIAVLLDIVHSHAVKNTIEGINKFDGDEKQFFMGEHPAWGSMVFDYSKVGVLKFLLSNVKYYLDVFKFDGFRFDGVTSMLYKHFGLGTDFDSYAKYFSNDTNLDAINYLQLATEVARECKKDVILISEDMSGMPGMCIPVKDGGMGFDYRLNMGTPDLFVKLIDKVPDENWSMNQIYYELTSRRPGEKSIGYAESHDQALVGDKTIIFRLCDKEMYWHMAKDDNNFMIQRGMSLYKLIYGISMTLGGEGYLNFMGNEFGHPEWIDFPREGNNGSYKYARRQWGLRNDENLKYQCLNNFNKDLIGICNKNQIGKLADIQIFIDENAKLISYRKGNLLFVMSFHYDYSPEDLFLQLNEKAYAKLIFTSDSSQYGGCSRLKEGEVHSPVNKDGNDGVMVYVPCRSFNVYKLTKTKPKA